MSFFGILKNSEENNNWKLAKGELINSIADYSSDELYEAKPIAIRPARAKEPAPEGAVTERKLMSRGSPLHSEGASTSTCNHVGLEQRQCLHGRGSCPLKQQLAAGVGGNATIAPERSAQEGV